MGTLDLPSAFETGIPSIDEDHRAILALANRIGDTVRADAAGWREAMVDFVAACRGHFAREEALLVESGFPRADRHRQYHARLLERAEALIAPDASDGADARARFEEMAALLVDDLVRGDSEFLSFVREWAERG